jgi:hypothetical protein
MRSIILRLVVAILTFIVGFTVARLFSTQSRIETTLHTVSYPTEVRRDHEELVPNCEKPSDATVDPALRSEIMFKRINGYILNRPFLEIVLRREDSKKFGDAIVTETELHTKKQRQGKLAASHYNDLLTRLEAQRYFCMKDEYAMEWVDSMNVTMSVSVGDKRKVIKTTNEGAVPSQLRLIYSAVDSALRKVRWGGR